MENKTTLTETRLIDGLNKLREPFPKYLISKLPRGSKAQNECDYKEKRKCDICGGFHHPKTLHLDYVGHAALTDRLLDCDLDWDWEPLAYNEKGLPVFDEIGGLWIKLTVLGRCRLGYGHPDEKKGGNAIKEVIGDALRNAAMRFGAALELWHKGSLHQNDQKQNKIKLTENHSHYSEICEAVKKGTRTIKGLNEIFDLKAVAEKLKIIEDKRNKEVKLFLENKEVK